MDALNEADVDDILRMQKERLPFASMAYRLGYADERTLVTGLSKQRGISAIVLDESVLNLKIVSRIDKATCLEHSLLAVDEDEERIYVAVWSPDNFEDMTRDTTSEGGKIWTPYLVLKCTLERSIRAAFRAIENNETVLKGKRVLESQGASPKVSLVASPLSDEANVKHHSRKKRSTDVNELSLESFDNQQTNTETQKPSSGRKKPVFDDKVETIKRAKPKKQHYKILIVDDDLASRHLLVKCFQPKGFLTQTASTGTEALKQLNDNPPDAVIMDVMLPEIDGFQVCHSIKKTKALSHMQVFLMSAVIGEANATEDVLQKHGADGYFEKPINTDAVFKEVNQKLNTRTTASNPSLNPESGKSAFDKAMAFYKEGDIQSAILLLEEGIKHSPLSAKLHFVLANLLQKEGKVFEAIEEYETTCDLRSDYFPALSRLAYLYYENGYTLKAIETWRASLPCCEDEAIKQKIEDFMKKLIEDMGQVPVVSFG